MKGPLDIHQYLLAHDVHHEIVRLPRTTSASHGLPESFEIPAERCVAVHPFHATAGTTEFLVVLLSTVVPGPDATAMTDVAAQLERDFEAPITLSPAPCDEVSRRTDYVASHLGPLLLPADVVVLATNDVAELASAVVYCPTGDGGTALGIPADELLALARARALPGRRPIPITRAPSAAAPVGVLPGPQAAELTPETAVPARVGQPA